MPLFEPVSELNLPEQERRVLEFWKREDVFRRSLHPQGPTYSFYEGPPTANGAPGIHHVQSRAYKDLFTRFRNMQGYFVPRKAGWDTHGLPVELAVEKQLGFASKREVEDYGVARFNAACRQSVFSYEQIWQDFTERMGYWLDFEQAYLTLTPDYIESVWWSLQRLWAEGLLYRGDRVVPYCPRDGTTLSSAEVSEGYRDTEDPSVYVRFPLERPEDLGLPAGSALLVWTTTPWTLPYNAAAALGERLEYVALRDQRGQVGIAAALRAEALGGEVLARFPAERLAGLRYLPPYQEAYRAEGAGADAFYTVLDAYVSAEEGSGIVHLAPAFGEDDFRLGSALGLPVLRGLDSTGRHRYGPWKGSWFKDSDPQIEADLRARSLLWRSERLRHSYPHCWRCGTPLVYYATESWFIRTTARKEALLAQNQTIDWHPAHIRDGRYGAWLENLVDWNLSRNRYWGTPLPIWQGDSGDIWVVGSFAELEELSRGGFKRSPDFDPHRPGIDQLILYHPSTGEALRRVPYVIDVWYDSGSMPFAQHHYPFAQAADFESRYPADFICEAVDQTRGWFNSLHVLGTLLFGKTSYRAVICHGHILDEAGNKMSKSKGNIVEPFAMFEQFGADVVRWYIYSSAPPELSRRFGPNLLAECQRRYLATLWNVYSFFVLYANLDLPDLDTAPLEAQRTLLDRWVGERLAQTAEQVTASLEAFDPTTAARAIEEFVVEDLSNWYVRRSRKRFWTQGAVDQAAYATLHRTLIDLSRLSAPFTPFLSELIYRNLAGRSGSAESSVHLTSWPELKPTDPELLADMELARRVVRLGRALRTERNLKVRQPLAVAWIRVPEGRQVVLERLGDLIREELNVRELRSLESGSALVQYRLRPNLKLLGPRYGARLPLLRELLDGLAPEQIAALRSGETLVLGGFELTSEEVLIDLQTAPGYAAADDGVQLVALDLTVTPELEREGRARDLIRAVQQARKEAGLAVSDRIALELALEGPWSEAAAHFAQTIAEETLAVQLTLSPARLAGVDPEWAAVPGGAARFSVAESSGAASLA